jgi:hypothetical protein
MKNWFALILAVFFFACGQQQSTKDATFAEGKALAEKLNKPLLLDFMTDW